MTKNETLSLLHEIAIEFHNTRAKMGCYTAESFATCDTSLCVKAKKALQQSGKEDTMAIAQYTVTIEHALTEEELKKVETYIRSSLQGLTRVFNVSVANIARNSICNQMCLTSQV